MDGKHLKPVVEVLPELTGGYPVLQILVGRRNDAGVDADGELAMIKTYSGFASYRRFWTPKWRSNLTGGDFKADNPTALVGLNPTDQVYSAHVNLIYSPIDKIDVGVEYIYANRRLESGVDGDMNKVQFSTKYSF